MRFNGSLRMKFGSIPALSIVSNHQNNYFCFRHVNSIAYELQQAPQNILIIIYWCECNMFAGACPVWKAGHIILFLPQPSLIDWAEVILFN